MGTITIPITFNQTCAAQQVYITVPKKRWHSEYRLIHFKVFNCRHDCDAVATIHMQTHSKVYRNLCSIVLSSGHCQYERNAVYLGFTHEDMFGPNEEGEQALFTFSLEFLISTKEAKPSVYIEMVLSNE